jgi:uncharacterized membrane protein YbhN (UPF0104 family)
MKRALHWGGSALAILGIVFVAIRLREYGAEIDFARFDSEAWLGVAGLALIYGASNLMLAMAWWNLLKQFGANTSRRWAIRIYGISQIARYVPGNIFHLAGRQAMGAAAGLSNWPLAKSAVWELGLISATGGLFGLLAFPLLVPGLPVTASAGLFAASIGIAAILLLRFIGLPAARAFGWYVGFLVVSALLFVGLVELLADTPVTGVGFWLPLGGAYVLAWLIGLVTPGAPAGVGVRELVLLFLLKGAVGEADLLLAVVMGRVVTVAGDLGFFGVSILMNDRAVKAVG